MSNQVVPMQQNQDWTPEQIKLITDTVAKGATPDELKLFLYRCKVLGLDPLKPGQIHFVKYGNSPGTIVVGIEGFRAKAGRTGKQSGAKRGVIRDDKGKCIGGWAEIYRHDWQHPAREEVALAEYSTGKGPWAKMPETMIKKVAEAAALRMAFPDDLGGIYVREEMDQAEASRSGAPLIRPEQPQEGDGEAYGEGDYRIPGGMYAKRSIPEVVKNVGAKEFEDYILRTEKKWASPTNKVPKPAWWDDFVTRAEGYLADHYAQEEAGSEG